MKVCTDACVLGAWFAEKMAHHSSILDIGSGTGLLMMMLAQKSKASIHGIELDPVCFNQLNENISRNEWKEKLTAWNGDVRTPDFQAKYDFIICNPPFFQNDLPAQNEEENIARHSNQLSLFELIQVIDEHLSPNGTFGILLPYTRWEYFNELSQERHFYLREKLFIRHSRAHDFSRAILHCSRCKENHIPVFELSIRSEDNASYTPEFIALLKDYYLYL